MTFFDAISLVKYYVGRFIWPVLFFLVGLYLLLMAMLPEMKELNNGKIIPVQQSSGFLYASLFFIFASAIWFLYIFDIIKSFVGYLILAVLAGCSAFLIYTDYANIKQTVDFKDAVDLRDLDIKARMDDIKQAELAYKEMNGTYTNSMDDLIDFVKNGKKMKIMKEGSIPERKITVEERDYLYHDDRPIDKLMSEIEAAALAKSPFALTDTTGLKGFIRDTNFVPVMTAIFLDEKRVANRAKIGASLPFYADSLRYVPHSKELVLLDTGSVLKGDLRVPTIYIEMIHPMYKQMGDTLVYSIGSLEENSLRESWKEK